MNILDFFKKYKTILLHIFWWLAFIIITGIQTYYYKGYIPKMFLARYSIGIAFFYLNYSVLVPQLLLKRKKMIYTVLVIILLIGIVDLNEFLTNTYEIQKIKVTNKPNIKSIINTLINIIFAVLAMALRMYTEWNNTENRKKEISTKNTMIELQYLKNQLNPHFFFNALNSIYALTVKKSEEAPEAVITLSELMRYMLYETNTPYVSLKKEIQYIENYMSLQRLRIANDEHVVLKIHGIIGHQQIPPLLLISFIENALKYGTDLSGNTKVNIEIYASEDQLQFTCINLIGRQNSNETHSGIGIANTKDRLQLLYPDAHFLDIKERDNKFIVELTLNL